MKTEEIFASTVLVPPNNGTENCLALGTRLADFEITGILGEGGFGIVYVAFDHSLQRTVAIKEYMPGTLAGRAADASVSVRAERHKDTFDAGLKSFINEARLLAQFDHPSLVKVYRFWEQNKTAYMAMRYYDGKTLKDIVQTRPEMITEAWLKFIFKQILEALDTLYKAKILHRDVSPDNIIVQKNGDAVLLDFGSARQIIGDMTQGLTVILKPGYAPVEQYADDATLRQGPWTDIYALAAVIYFAILKTPPPTSVARIIKDSLISLQQGQYPGFSEKFLYAIDRGLAIQPEDRPQTMDEFRRMLGISAFVSARNSRGANRNMPVPREAGDAAGSTRSKNSIRTVGKSRPRIEHEEPPEPSKRGRVSPALIAAALGLVFMLGIGIYVSRRPSAETASLASVTAPSESVTAKPAATLPPARVAPVASTPAASNASAIAAAELARQENADWNDLKDNATATKENFSAFLQKYPGGKFADAANARLAELSKAVEVASAPEAAAAQEASKEPAPVVGFVKLTIKPWGTIFVDGVQRGVSPPLKRLSLPEGKHKIRVSNPGFPDYVTEIDVGKKKLSTIEYEFTQR